MLEMIEVLKTDYIVFLRDGRMRTKAFFRILKHMYS